MPFGAFRCAHDARRDQFSEMLGLMIDRGQPGYWSATIGHDYLGPLLHTIEVLAEVVLEISDPDLETRYSY